MLTRSLRRWLNVGQKVPGVNLNIVKHTGGDVVVENNIDSNAFFQGKKVVLVGFPGAFTPTCQSSHIPEYIEALRDFKAKGVTVACLAVNDFFVMKEFASALQGEMTYIADGAGRFTQALEAGIDLSEAGLGFRTRRFAAVVDNGTITSLNDENSTKMTETSRASTILKTL